MSESGEEKHIEHLVRPVRDVFAAIFFVSVGMLIDPAVRMACWVYPVDWLVTVTLFLVRESSNAGARDGSSRAVV